MEDCVHLQLSLDEELNITPIPVKLMNTQYYTNWLPIKEMNILGNKSHRSKSSRRQMCLSSKPKRKTRKDNILDDSFSYFKEREVQDHKRIKLTGKKTNKPPQSPLKHVRSSREKLCSVKKQKQKEGKTVRHLEKTQGKKRRQSDVKNKKKKQYGIDVRKSPSHTSKKKQKFLEEGWKTEKKDMGHRLELQQKKNSEIIFDYYGISTSASDSPDLDHRQIKRPF